MVIKNSQPIVRMAIGLRGLERKSPIIGSQASLQPANILFSLNRDPCLFLNLVDSFFVSFLS